MDVDRPGLSGACSGVDIEWASDIPFHFSFPFHCLTLLKDEGDLAFEIEIHQRGEVVTVWSKECQKTTTLFSGHCQECDGIHKRLGELAQNARDSKKGTNYKFLSHDQLLRMSKHRRPRLQHRGPFRVGRRPRLARDDENAQPTGSRRSRRMPLVWGRWMEK
jgi:hypothetical protein